MVHDSWLCLVGALLFAAPAGVPFPNGSNTIGFFHREVGRVGFASTASSASGSGSLTLAGVPTGASVLHAWFYCYRQRENSAPSNPTFAGQSVLLEYIGTQSAVRSKNRRYAYRADVTALVPGDGTYTWNLHSTSCGAGLLVLYEDTTLPADYDIEVHDGVYGGSSADGGYQEWAPITFTGFTVDGTAAPEAEFALLMEGGSPGYTEWYRFAAEDDPLLDIAVHPADSACEWDRYDVSAFFVGGEQSARGTVREGTDAVNWLCGVVRVRITAPILDQAPPELTIAEPADGAVLAASPTAVLACVRDASATTLSSTPPLVWSPSAFAAPTAGESVASWPLGEGANVLTVRAFDQYGNDATASATVVLDTVTPEVAILEPLDGAYLSTPTVTCTAAVVDATPTEVVSNPAGIDATLPAGGGLAQGLVALQEGPNTIAVNALDAAGHLGGTAIVVELDTIAPALAIVAPLEDAVLADSPTPVRVEAQDASPLTLTIAGQPFALPAGGGSATAEVALVAGPNAIAITAVDAAGNATSGCRHVVLDLEAPIVAILSPADGTRVGIGGSPVGVVASVDDLTATAVVSSPSGVSASLPAGGGLATGSVALLEGHNPITVLATDAAGRTGSATVSVVFDTVPPELAILSPATGAAVRGRIDFHAAAADVPPGSGVTAVEFCVDGTAVETLAAPPYESSLDTSTLFDGGHRLSVRATDGVGNTSTAAVDVLVDNTPPHGAWRAPLDGAVAGGEIVLEVDAGDLTSGVARLELRAGGVPPLSGGSAVFDPPVTGTSHTGSENTMRWPDGPLALTLDVLDLAGNEARFAIGIEVDNTAPARTLLSPVHGTVVRGVVELLAEAADPHLASLELYVDDLLVASAAASPLRVLFDTTRRLDGAMVVTAVARDLAGNTGGDSATVTVDNLACAVEPHTLNLRSRGGDHSVTLRLEGPNVAMLLPTEARAIALRVAGGNPVPATAGWAGDDATGDDDHDGIPDLAVKFDRQALVAAIRAGLAAGELSAGSPVAVDVVAGGTFTLGTELLRIVGS